MKSYNIEIKREREMLQYLPPSQRMRALEILKANMTVIGHHQDCYDKENETK